MSMLGKSPKSAPESSGAGSGGTANPYLAGRQEWLERYGGYIARARQWRLCAFGVSAIAALSITGNLVQLHQQKIMPYIVLVDSLGKAMTTPIQPEAAKEIPTKLIQASIAQVIVNWRTVTADIDLQKKMIESLSHFVTGTAKGQLKEWYNKNQPYEIASSGKLIQVEVKSLPLPVSKNSWRLEWVETVRNHAGTQLEQHSYEATVTVKIIPPTTDDVVLRNPGGIYATDLSVAKQFAKGEQQ